MNFLSPCPGHAPLLRLTLWQVISSQTHHLQLVRALVAPPVRLIAGHMEVTGNFRVVSKCRLLLGLELILHQFWDFGLTFGHPWQGHLLILHVFGLEHVPHTFRFRQQSIRHLIGCYRKHRISTNNKPEDPKRLAIQKRMFNLSLNLLKVIYS